MKAETRVAHSFFVCLVPFIFLWISLWNMMMVMNITPLDSSDTKKISTDSVSIGVMNSIKNVGSTFRPTIYEK